MSKKKKFVAVILFFLLVLGIFALYVFFKPHRSIANEATVTVNADSIMTAYSRDEVSANALYLDKALLISGEIAELNINQAGQTVVILKTSDPISGIACTIKEKQATPLQIGQQITLKGFCSGFMADVVLRDCQIMSK